MPAFIDLTNHRFGRWTVLERGPDTAYRHPRWHCRCECGGEKLVTGQALRSGQSTSCGCYSRERASEVCRKRNSGGHGLSGTRVYHIWSGMRHGRKRYFNGPVCERWQSFDNFLADMGHPPTDRHTLDRIDNAKGYEPENCRWATMKEQQNNRTNNRRIAFDGEELTLAQWAERLGVSHKTISHRLGRLGWTTEQALTMSPSPLPRTRR